ncbi:MULTISPECIES: hypothetical protein [unclassified Pseudomonas]|uniref:hypothetical protein n=1 Tax=unclassified Pseudomonas TaxID=196821 RepID=UPI000CD099B8|nr:MULTISPECIES: hypothetical protein [unclassified Pseudomonas]POA34472.1 hypothetical protein C1887_04505 [Pseudomonas sp. GW456-R21]POA70542.1 hypothetical protein C1884_04080 [Pseudomonas sp. GW460-R15]
MSQYTALTARAAGDLDPEFGEDKDGKVILRFPDARDTSGECIAEGPDGEIYVGGSVDAEGIDIIHKLGIACLHKNGTLDTEFGKDGYVVLRFGPMQDTHLRQILFLTVGGEPRILLSGIDTKRGEVVLARLHIDGRVDERFGVKGLLTVKQPENLAKDLGLGFTPQTTASMDASGPCTVADGKIYVVMEVYMPIWIATVALLIRLNDDGSFDTAFNKTGYVAVTNQYWGNSTIKDILVHNGKITVCGTLAGHGMVARVNEDGSFDRTFADNGFKLVENPGPSLEKLVQYSEDAVLAAGWVSSPTRGVLVCLNDKGEFEPGFNDAKVLFQTFESGVMYFGVGLTNGNIIASGRLVSADGSPSFVVARYLINGKLDTDFGHGKGWSSTRFEDHYTVANTMTLQKDGNVLVLGDWGSGASYAALIARFLNPAASR